MDTQERLTHLLVSHASLVAREQEMPGYVDCFRSSFQHVHDFCHGMGAASFNTQVFPAFREALSRLRAHPRAAVAVQQWQFDCLHNQVAVQAGAQGQPVNRFVLAVPVLVVSQHDRFRELQAELVEAVRGALETSGCATDAQIASMDRPFVTSGGVRKLSVEASMTMFAGIRANEEEIEYTDSPRIVYLMVNFAGLVEGVTEFIGPADQFTHAANEAVEALGLQDVYVAAPMRLGDVVSPTLTTAFATYLMRSVERAAAPGVRLVAMANASGYLDICVQAADGARGQSIIEPEVYGEPASRLMETFQRVADQSGVPFRFVDETVLTPAGAYVQ